MPSTGAGTPAPSTGAVTPVPPQELYAPELLETLSSVQRQVAEFTDSETGGRPGTAEALETLRAMVDIQTVYDLDVADLADGRLMGLDTGTSE